MRFQLREPKGSKVRQVFRKRIRAVRKRDIVISITRFNGEARKINGVFPNPVEQLCHSGIAVVEGTFDSIPAAVRLKCKRLVSVFPALCHNLHSVTLCDGHSRFQDITFPVGLHINIVFKRGHLLISCCNLQIAVIIHRSPAAPNKLDAIKAAIRIIMCAAIQKRVIFHPGNHAFRLKLYPCVRKAARLRIRNCGRVD